jgi:PEP-CTERM motif
LKRSISIIAGMFAFTALTAVASPMFYSFEGTVASATSAGFSVGQAVRYAFVVDRAVDGYYSINGSSIAWTSYSDGYGLHERFSAQYLGGDAITTDLPKDLQVEFNLGFSETYYAGVQSGLDGSNADHSGYDNIAVFSYTSLIQNWVVGQSFFGSDETYGNGGYSEYVKSNLILTSISDTNPIGAVPEPSTLALMGLGMLGMGLAARKRRRA